MGRPKKQRDLEAQIEAEAGLTAKVESNLDTGLAVAEQEVKSEVLSASNEFNNEYSIKTKMDFGSVDISTIPNPDHRYEYRWIRTDELNMRTKTSNLPKEKGGWDTVKKPHALRCGFKEGEIGADGLVHLGSDLVLAFMPKEIYAIKREHEKSNIRSRTDGIMNRAKQGDGTIMPGKREGKEVVFGNKQTSEIVFTTREE